jgi:hypothetical protein
MNAKKNERQQLKMRLTNVDPQATIRLLILLCVVLELSFVCHCFSPLITTRQQVGRHHSFAPRPFMAAQRKSSEFAEAALLEEEETPANIAGSDFFGGNKQKEELFDPIAEAQATIAVSGAETGQNKYNRFNDESAFDNVGRAVAESLQNQINSILYGEEPLGEYTYSSDIEWSSVFGKGGSPLRQLELALDFYRRLDLAIVSAKQTSDDAVTVRWNLSVVWPIFWEARVVLTGTSLLELDQGNQISKQVDSLDTPDLLGAIASQVVPRFWDAYHIGMAPSAECMPRIAARSPPLSAYRVYEIIPRLVYKPSRLDTTNREDAYAEIIPNHAFACLIKTMGPKRQRYIPTSPLEVRVERNPPRISWNIPIAVELCTNAMLPLPGEDPETRPEACAEVEYEFQSRRRVATIPYGGAPQDVDVTQVRKQLYEKVVKDGFQPKLKDGRPQFFFLQNNAKACYTEEGLGMGVYDWRPKAAKANEVGIELELELELE